MNALSLFSAVKTQPKADKLAMIKPLNGSYSMAWAHKLLNTSPVLEAGIKKLVDAMLEGATVADGRPFFGKSRGAFAAIVAAATNRMMRDGAGAEWILRTAVKGAKVGMERFVKDNPKALNMGEIEKAIEAADKFLLAAKNED